MLVNLAGGRRATRGRVPELYPDRRFLRVQIATIEDLLNGPGPDLPRGLGGAHDPTFRRAARRRRSEGAPQRML